jgi:hypothetical protein
MCGLGGTDSSDFARLKSSQELGLGGFG